MAPRAQGALARFEVLGAEEHGVGVAQRERRKFIPRGRRGRCATSQTSPGEAGKMPRKMNHLRHGNTMTDHMMFEAWAELLRPQFPSQAEFAFRPRRRAICVSWPEPAVAEKPSFGLRSVLVTFTQMAWKTYRGARSARRARADANLAAFVSAALAQYDAENEDYETTGAELQLSVASVDIFPPPVSLPAAAAQGLAAL